MTPAELTELQRRLNLSDGKMAKAIGVTRQTWRNWKTGRRCPELARNALRWMAELHRISPANDNLPERIRSIAAIALVLLLMPDFISA